MAACISQKIIRREDCPLCGSTTTNFLHDADTSHLHVRNFLEDYYKGRITIADLKEWRYQVAECFKCGFIWQTYVLGDGLAQKLYSEWISPTESMEKKKTVGIALRRGYAEEVIAISLLLKKLPREISVLDYGMGWGHWCLMAQAFGYRVFGYEITSDRLSVAQKNNISVVDDGAIDAMRFGFINCEQVLEHVPDPRITFKKLAHSLERGGYLRVAVPNGAGIKRLMKSPLWTVGKNAIHPLEHVNCFTRKTLVSLGASVGLRPVNRLSLLRLLFPLPRLCVRHLLSDTSLYFLKT